MTLESFRRNLRGVNENTDFPVEFLNDIFYSIAKVWGGWNALSHSPMIIIPMSVLPYPLLSDIPLICPPLLQTALKLNESSSMDVSEQAFVELHQISSTPRGQMVHSDPGRCGRYGQV